MTRFCLRILLFTAVMSLVILGGGKLPNRAIMEDNLLGALPDKIQTAGRLDSPKILFVGGSNLSFGLDTQQIARHFRRPAYNMGLHAGLGLKFTMESSLSEIHSGDTVVVVPEYAQFSGGYFGSQELVATLCDVYPQGRATLSFAQSLHLLPQYVCYSARKLCQAMRLISEPSVSVVYKRDSFNAYGDAVAHWGLPPEPIADAPVLNSPPRIDSVAIEGMKRFRQEVRQRGAHFIVLPPGFKSRSYTNQKPLIEATEEALAAAGIPFAVRCSRYQFDDALFYNTPYHLTKQGVDRRTRLVIEDLDRLMR